MCLMAEMTARSSVSSLWSLSVHLDLRPQSLLMNNVACQMASAQLKAECTHHDFIHRTTALALYLVSSHADPLPQKGKGLVKCVYNLHPATLHSVVQSHCSILSHDALHDCLSSNSSLENGERGLGYPFRYCTSCKNTDYTSRGACLLRNR